MQEQHNTLHSDTCDLTKQNYRRVILADDQAENVTQK